MHSLHGRISSKQSVQLPYQNGQRLKGARAGRVVERGDAIVGERERNKRGETEGGERCDGRDGVSRQR
jgi:hypothetical protein